MSIERQIETGSCHPNLMEPDLGFPEIDFDFESMSFYDSNASSEPSLHSNDSIDCSAHFYTNCYEYSSDILDLSFITNPQPSNYVPDPFARDLEEFHAMLLSSQNKTSKYGIPVEPVYPQSYSTAESSDEVASSLPNTNVEWPSDMDGLFQLYESPIPSEL